MSKRDFTFHAFLCTSLDGFIAREDGTVQFPDEAIEGKQVIEGEDYGISAFISSLDAIVMGRTTFEQMLGFTHDGHGWQYGNTPLFVVSNSLQGLPSDSPDSVRLLKPSEDRSEVVDSLESILEAVSKTVGSGDGRMRKIYVDGGQVVRQFINAKLLDEITITTIPILIGTGIRLFGSLADDVKLDLLEAKHWVVGYTQMRYKLKYAPHYP